MRGLHLQPLAYERRRLPQRAGRLVRRLDLGPVGRGGSLRRVHGLHPALVLGAGRGGAAFRRRGAHHLLPARRRPRVPHLLHDRPRQRAGRRLPRPDRHDALRPPRGVGGQPRGLARGPSGRLAGRWAWLADLLVLALGRRRRRHLGARPAGPCRNGPAPAQPPWRPSAGTATTTDGPSSITLVWADAGYAGRFVRDARVTGCRDQPSASSSASSSGDRSGPEPLKVHTGSSSGGSWSTAIARWMATPSSLGRL